MKQSVFRSDEGRDKVRGIYNEILKIFPGEKRYVDTSFGKTFLLEIGKKDAPAVVLLHGSCGNSAFWLGDMPVLAEHLHVFSIDIIGEAGNSEENRLDFTTDAYSQWLNEVIKELGLASVNLIGNSLGGGLALNFAVNYPEKTERLVLLASSGIVPIESVFRSQTSAFMAGNKETKRDMNASMFDESAIPPEVLAFINLIMENFIPVTDDLPVYTDAQLGRLTMPVLYIAGELDNIFDTNDAAARLEKVMPNAKAHVQPDCGHVVIGAMPLILPFLLDK